jgi:hypothetical protein
MSKQMNWRRAQLLSKPSLDFRREHEFEDRASRWLKAVERRRLERRSIAPSTSSRVSGSHNNIITQ